MLDNTFQQILDQANNNLISYLCWVFAAIMNACMDTLNWHFSTSVFRDLDPTKWNPNVSWKYPNKLFGFFQIDAWHTFKALMLFAFMCSCLTYNGGHWYLDLFLRSGIWFIIFEGFWRGLSNK